MTTQMDRKVYDYIIKEFGKVSEPQLVAYMQLRGWTLSNNREWIKPNYRDDYETSDLELNVIIALMQAYNYKAIKMSATPIVKVN